MSEDAEGELAPATKVIVPPAPMVLSQDSPTALSHAAAAADVGVAVGALSVEPAAWAGFTWGLVEGFKRWMLRESYALATLNRTLATIKSYTRLAALAGALSAEQAALITAVKGYGRKQGRNLDTDRATTRRSAKKPQAVRLSLAHARALKEQPADTPQVRRDALLICLLLDHGLRVGELAALTVGSVDLAAGTLTFYREKVDLHQTRLLSTATLRAALAYLAHDRAGAAAAEALLLGSRRGGGLARDARHPLHPGPRAAPRRRHWPRQSLPARWPSLLGFSDTDLLALQEAGGWAALAMPRRCVERAKVANERVTLQT